MEYVYTSLAARALKVHDKARNGNVQHRAIIAFAGPPGSGKSTIAEEVVRRLNKRAAKPFAVVMSMDGFHLPRKTLDELPNREEAYERRGVAWTFDAPRAVSLVERLHDTKNDRTVVISAPNFDHAEKDPVEDAIVIPGDISLVIMRDFGCYTTRNLGTRLARSLTIRGSWTWMRKSPDIALRRDISKPVLNRIGRMLCGELQGMTWLMARRRGGSWLRRGL